MIRRPLMWWVFVNPFSVKMANSGYIWIRPGVTPGDPMRFILLLLLTGCTSQLQVGSLGAIKQRAFVQCYKHEIYDCLAYMRAEDAACGPFCEVLHGGLPDWQVCQPIARSLCRQTDPVYAQTASRR